MKRLSELLEGRRALGLLGELLESGRPGNLFVSLFKDRRGRG